MGRNKLGQHFLIDQSIVEAEIHYADLQKEDVVLEIGPGKGILTTRLATKVRQVIALEIDPTLVAFLQERVPSNVLLIHADAVTYDFKTLPPFTKIVANLPFQISSPLTFKLLDYPFEKAILIYQKDFAQRMIAQAGTKDYSRLSVAIYYKTYCKLLQNVGKTCFSPPPQVNASIVELCPRPHPPFEVLDETFFFTLTKHLFSHRRKKIQNTVKEYYGESIDSPYAEKRVDALTPEQIGAISTSLYKKFRNK